MKIERGKSEEVLQKGDAQATKESPRGDGDASPNSRRFVSHIGD